MRLETKPVAVYNVGTWKIHGGRHHYLSRRKLRNRHMTLLHGGTDLVEVCQIVCRSTSFLLEHWMAQPIAARPSDSLKPPPKDACTQSGRVGCECHPPGGLVCSVMVAAKKVFAKKLAPKTFCKKFWTARNIS